MGKTHLLHAIGNGILNADSRKKIVCASSEKFTLDFISSIQKNKTVEFSKTYRNADVLLIDDIQFFQGKEQTQEQFFHTFNELFQSGKQIVLTADRYPEKWSAFKIGCCRDLNQASLLISASGLRDPSRNCHGKSRIEWTQTTL